MREADLLKVRVDVDLWKDALRVGLLEILVAELDGRPKFQASDSFG